MSHRLDVIGQHRVVAHWGEGQDAAYQNRLGGLRECDAAVVRIDHRIAPDVGDTADSLNVCRGHRGASGGTRHLGRGCRQRHLLRVRIARQYREGDADHADSGFEVLRFRLHVVSFEVASAVVWPSNGAALSCERR